MNVPDEKIVEVVMAPASRAIMHAIRVDVEAKNPSGETMAGYALLFVANTTAAGAVIEAVELAATVVGLHDADKREAFKSLAEMLRRAVSDLDSRAPQPQTPLPEHVH